MVVVVQMAPFKRKIKLQKTVGEGIKNPRNTGDEHKNDNSIKLIHRQRDTSKNRRCNIFLLDQEKEEEEEQEE